MRIHVNKSGDYSKSDDINQYLFYPKHLARALAAHIAEYLMAT
jgi:hypothetical protein